MLTFFAGLSLGIVATALWVWYADRQFTPTLPSSYENGYANGFQDALDEMRAKRQAAGQKAAETRKAKGDTVTPPRDGEDMA